MLLRHNPNPLPTCFINHPNGKNIIAEADIRVTPRGRIRAKLVVFKNTKDLREFWNKALGHELGKNCQGAVNSLAQEVITFREGFPDKSHIQVDPRYFCLIGLQLKRLDAEVIAHESTHAGFAYAKRHTRTFWVDDGLIAEENICYPTGKVARSINNFLHKKNLFK